MLEHTRPEVTPVKYDRPAGVDFPPVLLKCSETVTERAEDSISSGNFDEDCGKGELSRTNEVRNPHWNIQGFLVQWKC